MKHRITVAVGIVLSIALLVYALRDVSPAEILEHLGDANLWLLAAATVVATVTFVFRAIRWRVLLQPAAADLPFASRFAAVCIGFMVNNVVPARVGEFARAYSLSRIENVTVSATLASLVVERLLDALVMVAFLVPAILLGAGDVAVSGTVRDLFTILVTIVSVGMVTLAILVRWPSGFLRVAERWSHGLAPDRVADHITGILASFVAGLGALRHGHLFVRALSWSIVVWGWNALSFYLGFLAFGIDTPGIPGALLLQTMIGFAVAVPSTPGFFGPFEAASRVALGLYAIEPARTISFAASYHIATFIPITLMGIWYMRRLGFSREELGHSDDLVHGAPDAGGSAAPDAGGSAAPDAGRSAVPAAGGEGGPDSAAGAHGERIR